MRLAITGGTGFVGGELIDRALAAGHEVMALTRRPQPAREGLRWVEGALDRPDQLARLAVGADAVIHVAGVVNAPDRTGFEAGNVAGTQAMVEAARHGGVARFVHVSSLAAREPGLSDYGWSKAEAERIVAASGLDWTMVRPPAIYGARDREMLDLFQMAKRGLVPLPPNRAVSLIEVGDLARLLLALAGDRASVGAILEADDGREGGWTPRELGRAIAAAVGRRALVVPLPRLALSLASRGDRLARGARARLTADRVRYFCHPDWSVDPARRPPASLWTPQVATPAGLRATADAYRARGWL
jgi:uncharacterized protein YbjT (DUF2867 family)